jgi:RimJ/RimL family protein N-acetyltransferase
LAYRAAFSKIIYGGNNVNFVIKTERLTLRPFQAEDAPALNQIANQDYVLKWMPDWESSIEDTERLIQYFTAQYPLASKTVAKVAFAVVLKDSIIGMVGIGNKEEVDNDIEIAYFISKDYSGKGYITEAAKAASRWALLNLKMDYLIAIVDTENYPSQRVVEKCGFKKVDTRRILNAGELQKKLFHYYRLYNA